MGQTEQDAGSLAPFLERGEIVIYLREPSADRPGIGLAKTVSVGRSESGAIEMVNIASWYSSSFTKPGQPPEWKVDPEDGSWLDGNDTAGLLDAIGIRAALKEALDMAERFAVQVEEEAHFADGGSETKRRIAELRKEFGL